LPFVCCCTAAAACRRQRCEFGGRCVVTDCFVRAYRSGRQFRIYCYALRCLRATVV
jgi:hypothetical protein